VVRQVVTDSSCGVTQLVERLANNEKVAKHWYRFRCSTLDLKKALNAIMDPSSLPVVVAQPDKRRQTKRAEAV